MECKNCNKGLTLKIIEQETPKELLDMFPGETITTMDAVACNCCGGFYERCENCEAGKRVINWVDK